MGITLSPLRFGESPKNVRAEFGLEGVESRSEGAESGSEGVKSKEVSELHLEEVEVLEQPLEGVSGEGSEWKECVVVLGTAGRGSE